MTSANIKSLRRTGVYSSRSAKSSFYLPAFEISRSYRTASGKSASTVCHVSHKETMLGRMRFVYLLFYFFQNSSTLYGLVAPLPPMKICLKPQRVIISSIKTNSEDADAEIAPINSQHLN